MNKYVYSEWIHPIKHFIKIEKVKEKNFEVILPCLIAILSVAVYSYNKLIDIAISKLSSLMPTVLAILIGFTISCITVIVSNDSSSKESIRNKINNGRIINGRAITYGKYLLVNYTYILIVEIFFFIFIFVNLFFKGVFNNLYFSHLVLFVYVFLVLHLFFIILRSITSLYFISINSND